MSDKVLDKVLDIYTKDNCAECQKVKHQLRLIGVPFKEINVEQNLEAKQFLLNNNHRSVPQLYYKNQLISKSNPGASPLIADVIYARMTEIENQKNIVLLKLITGEVIIAECVSETAEKIMITQPWVMGANNGVFKPLDTFSPEQPIIVYKASIILHSTPNDKQKNDYINKPNARSQPGVLLG